MAVSGCILTGMDADVLFRAELLAAGTTAKELRASCERGELHVVQRGAYTPMVPASRTERHLLDIRAAVERLSDDAVVSGVSAVVLHGLASWRLPVGRVHVLRPAASGARRGRLVQVHTARLEDDDVVEVDGIAVTSVARTVVDVARTLPFEQAVVIVDHALHRHLVTRPHLERVLDSSPRARGTSKARRAVAFAHPGAESPGESRSRVAMHRLGVDPPTPQWRVVDSGARVIARVDFGWPEHGVVGEFDGLIKYSRGRGVEAVVAEKLREDAVRDTSLRVVRWIWPELDDFEQVARRLERAGVPRARR